MSSSSRGLSSDNVGPSAGSVGHYGRLGHDISRPRRADPADIVYLQSLPLSFTEQGEPGEPREDDCKEGVREGRLRASQAARGEEVWPQKGLKALTYYPYLTARAYTPLLMYTPLPYPKPT